MSAEKLKVLGEMILEAEERRIGMKATAREDLGWEKSKMRVRKQLFVLK